jgi:hypothetical protein
MAHQYLFEQALVIFNLFSDVTQLFTNYLIASIKKYQSVKLFYVDCLLVDHPLMELEFDWILSPRVRIVVTP